MTATIVTLTLNPTIDGAAEAETIRPLHKIRTSNESYDAGGGGINAARVIGALGGSATAVYLAGGATGGVLDSLVGSAGVAGRRVDMAAHTRIAHAIFERSSGLEYRFVPEGPEINEREWAACRDVIAGMEWDYLIASGSLPRAAPDAAYAELADMARARGARLVLDSSGEALREALARGVYLVKPSLGELERLLGENLSDDDRRIAAARDLIARGAAEIVALSLGRDGAILITKDERWRVHPPPIDARSAVGAGDSFVGAMTLALARGEAVRTAFAYGVAAGTAAVLSPGYGLARADDVERLFAVIMGTAPRP